MFRRFGLIFALSIWLTSLALGCTMHPVPKKIPRLETSEGLAGPFNNLTVTLINQQTDDSTYTVKHGTFGNDTVLRLNRKIWTEKAVEALKAELVARDAKVVEEAPVTISLKITEIAFRAAPFAKIWLDAKTNVTSNSGWTKTYVAMGDATEWGSDKFTRATNHAISEVVRAVGREDALKLLNF